MSLHKRWAGLAMALLLGLPELLGLPVSGSAWAQTADDGWRWSIAPYIWGSGIEADVEFPSGQAIGGELTFDEIVDALDITAMVHVEGHRGEWGLFTDILYLEMSDDGARGQISTETDIDFAIYEIAGVYTPGGASGPFSMFAGARFIDMSLDITFRGTGPLGIVVQRSADDTFTDFMVGGRYLHAFNDRWLLNLRGDLGGGDSELGWNVLALLGWRFGKDLDDAVLVGWRHMELEFENEGIETDVTMDGPIAGVLFGF